MPNPAQSSPQAKPADESPTPATYEEYVAAVKFVLMTAHRTPELVANELLAADEPYLKASWERYQANPDIILEVAAEISLDPDEDEPSERAQDTRCTLAIPVTEPVHALLARLAKAGLYGDTETEVARAMITRGIEAVLPVLGALRL